jgi:hypothetical protein
MQKAGAFFLSLLLILPALLYAQEDDEINEWDPEVESDWDIYAPDIYTSGDQTFVISLGTVFPAVFLNNGKVIDHKFEPPVGGTGSLSYNYFFNSNIFVGGEIGGMFIPTLGKNTAFIIPLGVRTGYQFIVWKLEFPLAITLGMTWHRYLDLGYYGFYMKGGGGAYFRYNAEWSFGLSANWCWFPEWTNDRSKNVDGNIVDLMLSVRYHF